MCDEHEAGLVGWCSLDADTISPILAKLYKNINFNVYHVLHVDTHARLASTSACAKSYTQDTTTQSQFPTKAQHTKPTLYIQQVLLYTLHIAFTCSHIIPLNVAPPPAKGNRAANHQPTQDKHLCCSYSCSCLIFSDGSLELPLHRRMC